jgi:2-(1,2-epoxy-1,2-dihydrophenyl)acetyl-CoA isomerase
MADEISASDAELVLRIADGVAYATINRPAARNALATPIIHRLLTFLEQIKTDRSVRVLLLQASGKTFVAGGDVKLFAAGLEMSAEARADDMKARGARGGALCSALAELPQPVLVAARGPAVGIGVSLILAADLAIVSETSSLLLSHVTLGLNPDGAATYFLPRQIGLKRAAEVALLGDPIDAQAALAMGLVNWVAPDDELNLRAEQLARRLAAGPATAIAETKLLLQASHKHDVEGQVAAEAESMRRSALSKDYAEGLRALLERRAPRFGQA